jgi:hypothetical protein
MRRAGIVAILAVCIVAIIGGAIAWLKIKYPTFSYRYRLTLALEIDGKVHTGASIVEVIWKGGPEFGDVGPYHPNVRGQAVFIDLGSRGAVVATLVNGESYGAAADGAINALWLLPRAFGKGSVNNELAQLPQLHGRRDLAPDNMPRLIWFTDIADSKTARKFRLDDIPGLFGTNARLAAAFVETTSDPIVLDIEKKIPWLTTLRRPPGWGVIEIGYGFTLVKSMFIGDET